MSGVSRRLSRSASRSVSRGASQPVVCWFAVDKYAEWITKGQAAELLQTSERTIERLINRGKIEQAQRRIPGRSAPLTIVNPRDVERIRDTTAQPVFPVPADVELSLQRQTAPVVAPSSQPVATLQQPIDVPPLPPQRIELVLRRANRSRYVTLKAASAYIGLPQTYLTQLRKDKVLPATKAGRSWYFRTADLDRL